MVSPIQQTPSDFTACNLAHDPMSTLRRIAATLAFLSLARLVSAEPLPFVHPVFTSHMVLQRDKTNTLWGWAGPGEKIRLEISGQTTTATTTADGRWQAQFLPPKTGGPYTLTIRSLEQTVSLTNLLVGDVWLCGGQSNMEFPLGRARNGAEEITAAEHPQIRLFTVKAQPAYAPRSVVQGAWKVCSPKTVTEDGGFSAVAYFFARKIQSQTNVPLALIQDCLGGTPAESWTSPATLRMLKDFDPALDEVARLHDQGAPEYGNYMMHWYDQYDTGQKENWAAPELDDHDWKNVTLPGGFAALGVADVPGVCYFRKSVVLPDPLPAGRAQIFLGVIERMDTTHINGQWIGAILLSRAIFRSTS